MKQLSIMLNFVLFRMGTYLGNFKGPRGDQGSDYEEPTGSSLGRLHSKERKVKGG